MIRNYVIVCDFILACYWLYTLKFSPMCQMLCHEIFMLVVGIVNARSVKITPLLVLLQRVSRVTVKKLTVFCMCYQTSKVYKLISELILLYYSNEFKVFQ